MAPPAGARCARHASTAAVDLCQRCGTFVCGECVHIRAEDVYCVDCAAIFDRPAPKRPRVAFALALAPAPLAFALTIIAGVLGTMIGAGLLLPLTMTALALMLQERSARARGQSALKGVFYPLTWGMLAIDLLATAALVVAFVRGR